MKCTVRIKIEQVACPGTIHLRNKNPVFLTFYLFGRIHQSHPVYPTFPLIFNCKFKFCRIFTNAKTPDHVLEILEDDSILIELKQESKRLKGGHVIATYEEAAKPFLFPAESIIPKEDHLEQKVLLTRTKYFNKGKSVGLDPELTFRTKTVIEVNDYSPLKSTFSHLCKQLPHTSYRNSSFVPAIKAHEIEDRLSNTTAFQPSKKATINTDDNFSKSLPIPNGKSKSILKTHATQNDITSNSKHCICECPELEDTDVNQWLDHSEEKSKKRVKKPFRTGKEPKNLISKRDFEDADDSRLSPRQKLFKGICKSCAVPLKSCTLCSAYKTVYGNEQFLAHRLQRKYTKSPSPDSPTSSISPEKRKEYVNEISQSLVKNNKSAFFENLPTSTPYVEKHVRIPTVTTLSDDDENLEIPSEEELERRHDEVPEERIERKLFHQRGDDYKTTNARKKDTYVHETERIHNRIKELMIKNDSVLQYELSSEESDSEDIEYDGRGLQYSPKSTSSRRRSLPSRSAVTPIGGSEYWRSQCFSVDRRSRREVFDASLRQKYKELYDDTLQSYHGHTSP